ncbi:AraC family two component transcriptional regulator [Hydrogenispora ethanolica]|uniref:AraC family two component transcriptional regulator n=1 Tax=Hydrogenispora ethanolica TaxID=1082276 RepID=A0A4R1RIL4_HYDET|nr:response regulator [Hydrogenispora ethanolica]TCL65941.1 AraC family two component transcriptional regulator [Hydrogenispora ethanolica]
MYKLLIADDEPLEREAIRFIVREHFGAVFEMREAANGREAVKQAFEFRPDVIFFDIKMPGLNGLEAAARIRTELPECRLIVISAYHHFHYAKDAVSLRADEYITKPAPADEIVAVLRKVTGIIDDHRTRQRQEEEMAERLRQVTQFLKEELLLLIVRGEAEEELIREYFSLVNLQSHSFVFAVLALDDGRAPGGGAGIEWTLRRKTALERVKLILADRGYDCLTGLVGQEIDLLLLLDPGLDEYGARLAGVELLSAIKETLELELELTVNVGIGNLCSDSAGIYASFLQAKFALRYEPAPGALNSYGDIHKGEAGQAYPFNKERSLCEQLIQGDSEAALRLLEEILEWFSLDGAGLDALKERSYQLLLALLREAGLNANLNEFGADPVALRRDLFLQESGREVKAFAKQFLMAKIGEINRLKISRANALLARAVAYLEEHFSKEISLEEVAEAIRISPFYLSKLFKKELGATFLDYLTALRIQQAKLILADPLSSVKDACFQVGYRDPNYFARVFKKSCGMTPTEYKANPLGH